MASVPVGRFAAIRWCPDRRPACRDMAWGGCPGEFVSAESHRLASSFKQRLRHPAPPACDRQLMGPEEGSMSVLAVFRWEGDPDALLAAYDWELQQAVPASNPVE